MQQLSLYRNNKAIWQKLAYSPSIFISDDGYECNYDTNAKARYALLIELQYDLQAQDEALVRYLFTQEILKYQKASMGGVSDELLLNAYLLASFKNPNDILLFYNAKHSSFDASFVIDNEFMFYALKGKTEAFVKDNFLEIYDDLQGMYVQYDYDDALEAWWNHLSSNYPEQEADEHLYTLYQRHFYLENYELAKNYLEAWNEATPDSVNKKSALKYAYIELKEYLPVIELLKEELAGSDSHWDNVSCYSNLLKFYTRTEQSANALRAVDCIDKELKQFSDWKNVGLGRMTIEQIFEFSLLTDNTAFGIKAFNIAYKWLRKIQYDLSYVGLDTALKAANKYDLTIQANKLEKLLIAEQHRIEKDLMPKSRFKSLLSTLFR
ncbi:hypothetical protein [Psychrobacter alimentarius]|uniref:hypothetical protein n=1 Tax=Psychrobacter alimentarius TaxID=261164 RepID=UPI001917C2EF|nr:hypothetical protein [Psychrobacter alimentarius]